MRLIDADAIGNPYENTSLAFEFMVLKKILDDAPTVDVVSREEYDKLKDLCEQYRYERDVLEDAQRNKVEVVRCKDCKWVRKAGTLMEERREE